MIDFRHLALLPDDERERCERFLSRGCEQQAETRLMNRVHDRAEEIIQYTLGFAPQSPESVQAAFDQGWSYMGICKMDAEQLLELMLELDMGD